jgi:hypothetical protein
MSARVLGIDIGSQGAIALLTPSGDLLEVVDMPVLRDGPKGRPNVNAALLAEIVVKMQAAMAFVEFVGARPGEGAVGRSHSAAPVASSKASVAPLAFRSHS